MSATTVIRPLGPSHLLSVANTAHAVVTIRPSGNDNSNFAAFTNTGSTDIMVVVTPIGVTPDTPVFPADGTPTTMNSFILPRVMSGATVLAVPVNGFNVTAIASGAGPSSLYITPVGDQS